MRKKISVFIIVVILTAAGISLKLFLDAIYRIPILMYHSIDYTSDKKDKLTVSPEVFARQMKYLRDHKYNVIPAGEAVSYVKDKRMPPYKTVAITFDDGYENNYTYAYPILKKYNIPATIFIIVDLVGKEGFLTWSQIKEMSKSGVIDMESHTMSHLMLPYIDDAALKHQVEDSRKALSAKLDRSVYYLCYPMGRYDERVKAAAKKAGYKAAFATKPTRLAPDYDIYEIKRVRISPTANNMFVFAIKLSGYHTFFRTMRHSNEDAPYTLWKKRKS